MLKLVFTSMIEPFTFHPLTVWWSVKGNFDMFFGTKKGWGEMTRTGFGADNSIKDLRQKEGKLFWKSYKRFWKTNA
jgi:hypothetical protein